MRCRGRAGRGSELTFSCRSTRSVRWYQRWTPNRPGAQAGRFGTGRRVQTPPRGGHAPRYGAGAARPATRQHCCSCGACSFVRRLTGLPIARRPATHVENLPRLSCRMGSSRFFSSTRSCRACTRSARERTQPAGQPAPCLDVVAALLRKVDAQHARESASNDFVCRSRASRAMAAAPPCPHAAAPRAGSSLSTLPTARQPWPHSSPSGSGEPHHSRATNSDMALRAPRVASVYFGGGAL
jgi:hypothetical protein